MVTWNYRVIRKEHETGDTTFQIHEVYYDESEEIDSWTQNAVEPLGETIGELREDIRYFQSAFRKPILEEAREDGRVVLRSAYESQEINDGHYFELMDRTSVALDHCVEFIGSHPVVRKNAKLRVIFEKAEEALAELYQEAGRLEYERTGG